MITREENDKTRFSNDIPNSPGINYDIPTNGVFQVKWPNGNLRYEWGYKDGKRIDGISKGWYPDGSLKQTMSWKNGKQDGLHTGWHGNGQKRFEITYKDDEVNGLWTTWYENGQKKYERTYKDGKKISEKGWDDCGKKILEKYLIVSVPPNTYDDE